MIFSAAIKEKIVVFYGQEALIAMLSKPMYVFQFIEGFTVFSLITAENIIRHSAHS